MCQLKCKSSNDCSSKQYCTIEGICKNICKHDKQCPDGSICYSNPSEPGTCVPACSTDFHCNENKDQYCFSHFNACVTKCGLVGCPSGWTCQNYSNVQLQLDYKICQKLVLHTFCISLKYLIY